MSEITMESLRQTRGKVALKVTSSLCVPCKQMSLYDEDICKEEGWELLHLDASLPLVLKLGVRGIPTYLLFMEGELTRRKSGFMPKEKFRDFLCS
jgi:thioredoxin 1